MTCADGMIVATQDNSHYENCKAALRLGYDVLLEKPISTTAAQVLEIERLAKQANKRVMVCFVLRFAAFYRGCKDRQAGQTANPFPTGSEEARCWENGRRYAEGKE